MRTCYHKNLNLRSENAAVREASLPQRMERRLLCAHGEVSTVFYLQWIREDDLY